MKVLDQHYYHVFNQGNYGQLIFPNQSDYMLFINLVEKHLQPSCSIIAFSLLPNQFHLLVKINDFGALPVKIGSLLLTNFSNSLRYLQSRYAQSNNVKYSKRGHLFQQKAKVIMFDNLCIDNMNYYIDFLHSLPVNNGLIKSAKKWRFSSIHQHEKTEIYESLLAVDHINQ